MMKVIDSNCNEILVERTYRTSGGNPIVIARLAGDTARGYLVEDEGTGGFGNEECPSSYGMPCLTWFGPGERYPDATAALAALAD